MSSSGSSNPSSSPSQIPPPQLYPCHPVDWLWLPRPLRLLLGWIIVILFSLSFLSIPLSLILLLPVVWRTCPIMASAYILSVIISYLLPLKEWPHARKWCQLTYEIFQVSGNLSPSELQKALEEGEKKKFMIGMHPHGIIPIHALIWCAYCDQYMSDGKRGLYGFGAMADVVGYVPFLRNAMSWLSGGSASYKALHDGLTKGVSPVVNASGRTPRHLYILPGGVAEIFLSTPGKHEIITNRKGLMRLALETGTSIFPCYVFGGTDFYNNLATGDNLFSKISRKFRMGISLFYGQYGLPIVPYAPKVTLCIGDPIEVKKWEGEGSVPAELIDELQQKYATSFLELFEKYKSVAGYPESKLIIH